MRTTRLEAFSDGVFAIAITLLALELPRPEGDDLWHELGTRWEAYAAFVVSFLTIGIIWVNHHGLLDRMRNADRTLLFLNLLLLMWVSLIPWPTGLVAEHLSDPGAEAATAVFSAIFLGMALSFSAFWLYALRHGHLEDLSKAQVRHLTRRNALGWTFYAVALALAFVVPAASLALNFAIALYYLLPDRAARLV
jgi:TMEM175 potassium channel family protein